MFLTYIPSTSLLVRPVCWNTDQFSGHQMGASNHVERTYPMNWVKGWWPLSWAWSSSASNAWRICSAGRNGRDITFRRYLSSRSMYAVDIPNVRTFRYRACEKWNTQPFWMVCGKTSRTACIAAEKIQGKSKINIVL